MKTILYIINTYGFGGLNRVIAEKASYFTDKGYRVHILCVDNQKNVDVKSIYDERIVHHTIDRDTLDKYLAIPLIGRLIRFVYYRLFLLKAIYSVNPDVVISTLPMIEPTSVVWLTFWKKRFMEFHGFWDYPKYKITLKAKIQFRLKYGFYQLIALTQREAGMVSKITGHPVSVIPNPLYVLPTIYSDCSSKNVITMARFSRQKNLASIVPAWKEIEEKHPDWNLIIMGKGEEDAKIRKAIEDAQLKTVKIMPYSLNVGERLVDSSIYVLPSLYEGFPLVLLESMSYGVPVVAYDCPCGPSEVIKDGYDGYVTEYLNPTQLMERVNVLIENEELRKQMGVRARKDIQRYNLDAIMQVWMDLFDGKPIQRIWELNLH